MSVGLANSRRLACRDSGLAVVTTVPKLREKPVILHAKRYFIARGAGFVGSHFVDRLRVRRYRRHQDAGDRWCIWPPHGHLSTARRHRLPSPRLGAQIEVPISLADLENLFICSSAVFPTSGHANPTLTIVALARRLGAELAGRGSAPVRRAGLGELLRG